MQVILQDGKNLIILSVRDVASRYLLAYTPEGYQIKFLIPKLTRPYTVYCKERT